MRVTNAGNVGIGTTAPTHLLNVDGTVNLTGGSGKQGLVVDSNGQVVIGNPETPTNSSMLLTISGGDLNVSGSVYYGGALVQMSPIVLQSAEGEPIPICMRNSAGKWVGCMPDENNNLVCGPNRECDEKILKVESERKLRAEGLDEKAIGERIEVLRQKFKEGKSLAAIKDELMAEVGNLGVLDELDDTQPKGNAFGVQTVSQSLNVYEDIDALKKENDVLTSEVEALKQEVSELKGFLTTRGVDWLKSPLNSS